LIEFFLFTFAFATFIAGFALFAERRFGYGPHQVGYIFMYSGFLGIIVQGAMRQGALVRKLGEVRLVTVGFLSAAVGYALLGFSFGLALLLVAAGLSSFGTGVLRPALTSLITQQVSRNEQGVVLGLNQSLLSIAQIAGPAIAGALIDAGHLTLWALWAALIMALALLLNFRAREARHQAALGPV
jgi:MFS family permease